MLNHEIGGSASSYKKGQDENKGQSQIRLLLNILANSHIYALVQERNKGKFMIIEARWCSSTYNRCNTKISQQLKDSKNSIIVPGGSRRIKNDRVGLIGAHRLEYGRRTGALHSAGG